MRVLVTGGAGYVGSVLVPRLLAAGHEVIVVDLMWFGDHLPRHGNLDVANQDFRYFYVNKWADAVIHLAAVANDPTGDLDPALTWEINALGTQQLADRCVRAGVRQFIYASSGSVYGVSSDEQVTEETDLDPISAYNKTKMVAERCLLSYAKDMFVQIIRPATVCGVSPRQRLDVVVNMLTMQAKSGKLVLMSPEAMRPHIHIDDMCDLYLWMLERPYLDGVWNAGFENELVMDTAKRLGVEIEIRTSNDKRSYRMNSDKLLAEGFRPKKSIADAIAEIRAAGLEDKDECHNIRQMKRLRLA